MAQEIAQVQSQFKRSLTGIRWVDPANFHFTLKFLGEIEEEKVAPIGNALEQALRAVARFSILGKGIGVFPDIKRARVLWAGLRGKDLEPLARVVETSLEPIGFDREKRGFRPHLTIGRWRHPVKQPERLMQEIGRWQEHDFGASQVEEVVLFQSVLKPEGAAYTPLRALTLATS